jgi:alpha-D-ribose 1-methylphosphonate 5-triphosphate diphosphatase
MDAIQGIVGGRMLLPDGVNASTELVFEGGSIVAVGERVSGRRIDARGLLVLPGLVDIHGDAFERQLAPRPEVRFPLGMALADTDRQLIANGITTAFHGITCSWEGGLRGCDMARALVRHLSVPNGFAADNCVHLRFENHNLDAVEEVLGWLDAGLVDFLAFNDHLPSMIECAGDDAKMSKYAERGGISTERFRALLFGTYERTAEVPRAVASLAGKARERGVAMASHDDMTRADRERYQYLGCDIAEFPMRREAALAARDFGNQVVMGSPNVVRGGSHLGGIIAANMIAEGICTILASDYYYPAMLAAPFRLAADGVVSLAAAWPLVSRNPARAAGLADRGEIAAGQRADLLLIDDTRPGEPKLVASLVAGVLRHVSQPLVWG